MIELAAGLLNVATDAVMVGAIVFLRVGAMMAILPAFGERNVPERVRLVLAIAFTLVIAPGAAPAVNTALDANVSMLALLGSEVLAGLILGIAIRLFVLGLQTAGAIAAQATSLAQIFGNIVVDPQPAIANVMVIAGLALAVLLGLHIKVVEYVLLSFELFPPGQMPEPDDLMAWGTSHVSEMFALAFVLAAPFVVISLLYNLALGAINRAMPQLMVAFVGAPAITMGALLLLAISLPFLLGAWIAAMDAFFIDPFGAR
ncbi:MAG: flagellar biosynthetic protein FliR [Pseudomonadota bacterium]